MKPSDPGAAVSSRSGLAVVFALAIVYVVWGSTYLGIHFALEGGFPPFLMAGGRFLLAGLLMYAVLRWRGVPAPTRAQWKDLVFMGVLLMVLGNGMVSIAEQWVSSGLAAVAVANGCQSASTSGWMGTAVSFACGAARFNSGRTVSERMAARDRRVWKIWSCETAFRRLAFRARTMSG